MNLIRSICFVLCMTATLALAQSDLSLDETSAGTMSGEIVLNDVTHDSGVTFVHQDGSYGQYYLVESMTGGLSLIDFDCDGDLDIYFLNGARIPLGSSSEDRSLSSREPSPAVAANALYRNDGGFHFTDVTQQAGVGDTGMGLGVASADFDNNGFPDIYVNNYGENRLFYNNGDGTFSDRTGQAGVGNGSLVGSGVAFFDMDGDGDLDLYAANYIQFDPASHRTHIHKGVPAYPSPMSFDPEPDTLFSNNGDGTFTDVSETSGIRDVSGRSMGLVAFDFDNDSDTDVVVANDTQENYLFENDGTGHFEEIGLLAGLAYDYRGKPQASMGIEVLDFDRDGLQDLYFTSFSEEFATCYQNLDGGLFDDVTLRLGASKASFPHVTWGIVAQDFNNDGEVDVYIGAGDLDVNRERRGGMSSTTAYRVSDIVLQSKQSKLIDLANNWGSGAKVKQSTRGVVTNDLDQDGRADVVTLNARSSPTLLRNESDKRGWLQIRLVGITNNRDGIGAKVSVIQGKLTWQRPVICGHSYQSDSSPWLHFGLPDLEQPVKVFVRWSDGTSQQIENIAVGQKLTVIQSP